MRAYSYIHLLCKFENCTTSIYQIDLLLLDLFIAVRYVLLKIEMYGWKNLLFLNFSKDSPFYVDYVTYI